MTKARMTISELKDLLKNGPVKLVSDSGWGSITVYALDKDDYLLTIDQDDNGDCLNPEMLNEFPSKKPERTPYYRWKLWLDDGDMLEPSCYISENGTCGNGDYFSDWHEAIKREKIEGSETYKVEGQK